MPRFEHVPVGNGTQLYLAEDHSVPLVSVAVAVKAGYRQDPPGREGSSVLAAALLDEGRSLSHTRDRFGALGAELRTWSSANLLALRCTVHRDDAAAATRLLVDQLREPFASIDTFRRVRKRQRTRLDSLRLDAESVAGMGLIFGAYGVAPATSLLSMGSAESIAALEFEELSAWLQARMCPERARVMIAGDVTRAAAEGWVQEATRGWLAAPNVHDVEPPEATALKGVNFVFVPVPDAEGAHVAFGGHREPTQSPHGLAHAAADSMLYGSLQYELRHKGRFTYGLHVDHWPTRMGIVGQASVVVASKDAGRVAARMYAVLKRVRDGAPVHESRLHRYRGTVSIGLMDAVASPEAMLHYLHQTADAGLPVDRSVRDLDALEGLTVAKVTRAMRELCSPNELRMAVVGRPQTVGMARDSLPANLAMVQTLDTVAGPATPSPPSEPPPRGPLGTDEASPTL